MDFFANAFQERVITPQPSEQHKRSQRELEGGDDDDNIVKDGIAIKPKESDPPLVYTAVATEVVMCEICGSRPAKYKCPGCLCQTCSLACSKQHKVDTTCSGVRSRTHFVDRKTYSEQDMMSDYGFLQEMGRVSDNAARENLSLGGLTSIHRLHNHGHQQHKRGRGGRGGRGGHHHRHQSTPLIQELDAAQELELQGSLGLSSFKDKQLVRQAKFRGTQLTRMADGLQRHKENQSYWNTKYKNMIWTIEWLFPEVEASTATKTTTRRILAHRNIDTHTLKDLLTKQLVPPPPAHSSAESDSEKQPDDLKPLADRYLNRLDQCRLFLLIPLRNTKKPALYRLDTQDTLQKALMFKKVLEYPTILVFGPEHEPSKEGEQTGDEATEETSARNGDKLLENYTIEEAPTAWPTAAPRRKGDNHGEDEEAEEEGAEGEGDDDDEGNRRKKKARIEESSEAESSSSSDSDSDSDSSEEDDSGESSEDEEEEAGEKKTSEAAAAVEDKEEADGDAENEQAARFAVGQAVLEAFAQDFGEQA
ncbi:hypothetical protein DFQ27_003907 [Actinomortierella ambigua]|uniref:Box C/D snoRNA protein 1 n=1 Tax=Actinomortierella ambigua TaxID=1343610 RepID=A0A9P6U549_9FUNG|nr:hypothetical protein DFQ27_003907 [Actinomortierella ambigua]